MTDFNNRKKLTSNWFRTLRNQICAEFENLEAEAPQALYPGERRRNRGHAEGTSI